MKKLQSSLLTLLSFAPALLFAEENFSVSLDKFAEILIPEKISEDALCRSAGDASDTRPKSKQYKCREYPFGKTILGLSPDNFLKIKNPTADEKAQAKLWREEKVVFSEKITVRGKELNFIIHANREAKVDDENTTRRFELNDSTILRDSMRGRRGMPFFKIARKDSYDLAADVCSFFSGITLKGQEVSESWKKSYFLFTAKAKVKINPGELSFEHMRICTRVAFDLSNIEEPLQLRKIERPQIFGLKRVGLKVDVDANWLMSIGDFFSDLLTSHSFSDRIEDVLQERGDDIVKRKLNNGEYLDKLLDPVYEQSKEHALDKIRAANKLFKREIADLIENKCFELLGGSATRSYCRAFARRSDVRELIHLNVLKNADQELAETPWIRARRYDNSAAKPFSIEVDFSELEANLSSFVGG